MSLIISAIHHLISTKIHIHSLPQINQRKIFHHAADMTENIDFGIVNLSEQIKKSLKKM